MGPLIFAIPAMIMALIGIVVYATFGLLFGVFATTSAAGRLAPSKIGMTLGVGFLSFVVSKAMLGSGENGYENTILFVVSLLIGSFAMLFFAVVFAVTSRREQPQMTFKEQEFVDAQIKSDVEVGGWGLRKSSYSDNQHLKAREKHKRRQRDARLTSQHNTFSW
ncbi:hypothetical protein PH5382_03063 [Phaeobacter sp. CECT 5382]|nr:hypothetical protein PH5382_03063 [Phaeobacter sp. CECT 5382]